MQQGLHQRLVSLEREVDSFYNALYVVGIVVLGYHYHQLEDAHSRI